MQILQLSRTGQPQSWLSPRDAAIYYATDTICWTIGDVCTTLRGGMNAASGRQSTLDIHPIIAVDGESKVNAFDFEVSLTNAKLFARDRWTCAYCGSVHPGGHGLTREHIVPTGQGGKDVWQNVLSACARCNHYKDCRTPEQAGMKLLFLPYVPSVFESFILSGRNITGEAFEFLSSRVSKDSRWHGVDAEDFPRVLVHH